MLVALLDGREHPASELAFHAGASPQAASAHLAKLVAGGLLHATAAGRQRLFRLASADVSRALEALAAIAGSEPILGLSQSVAMTKLREARSCYDHLAGRLGVAITERLVERGAIRAAGDGFDLTPGGARFFARLEVDVDRARTGRRTFARACTDWTERRAHLAGSLGACVLDRFLSARWLERNGHDRALHVTPAGRAEFTRRFGVRFERP